MLLVASNFHLALDGYALAESKPYPPLGSMVVAATLRRRGHAVAFHDAMFEPGPETFERALDRVRPDKVLIVADHHAVPQKMCLAAQRKAAFAMLAAAKRRGLPTIASGPDASDRPYEYVAAGADVVLRGEPDEGLVAWVEGEGRPRGAVVAGDSVPKDVVPGHADVAPAPPMRDLGGLPAVPWELVDVAKYKAAWARHGGWEAPVSSARGCPYRCNWCAKPVWGRTYNLRPPADVVRDGKDVERLGAHHLWFVDDIFALKPSWTREFRDEVRKAGGILPYRCLSRADLLVREGTVGLLRETGCQEVWMGAESGSQRVLDAMDKDQDVREIAEAVRQLRAAGVRAGLFLQLGYPGEEHADVRATAAMVRRLMPDEIGISVSLPLPGTPFYDRVRDRMTSESWETAMDNRLLFQGTYAQPYYVAAREAIRHEHALWQGVAAAGRLVTGRSAGLRKDLRRAAATAIHAPRVPWHRLEMRWHSLRTA